MGPLVELRKMPSGGVTVATPDGAYTWGGNAEVHGRYQIVVVGKRKHRIGHYVDALATWIKRPLRLVSSDPLPLPPERPGQVVDIRTFLNIIVEPVIERVPARNAFERAMEGGR